MEVIANFKKHHILASAEARDCPICGTLIAACDNDGATLVYCMRDDCGYILDLATHMRLCSAIQNRIQSSYNKGRKHERETVQNGYGETIENA